ncbi:MAG: glycosyl transferase [Bacilli bacterium]
MKFGYFDDLKREYVITTPKTPYPWINYLGHDDFFSLISNTCGGYSFYKDAKLRRLTRYRYNNVPNDISGRFYYIKDENTIWNPGYLPTKTKLDKYECHHGLNYTRFISEKNGIETNLLCFVPNGDNCEINKLVISNNTKKTKEIDVYGCVEFCFYNTVDDSTNFQRNLNIAEVEVDDNTIYHKTEYRERRNHYSFWYVNKKHDGFDSDRDEFLGLQNGFEMPDNVKNGISKNSVCAGREPIGCHHFKLKIQKNSSVELIFMLGYVENNEDKKFIAPNIINKDKAHALMEKYDTVKKVDAAFNTLEDTWKDLLSTYIVKTPDEKFNRMANIWNQYQCMMTYCMSRSASYFESGTGRGMGFRDSCQDLLGFVHLIPQKAKERIIDIASIQFKNGSTYHQYQPLTKRGNADIGGGFNDDPLWLVAAASAYIRETGDFTILDYPTPYNNEKGSEEPLYNHLLASVNFTRTHLGPHGLPLIGRADWNDCLNLNCFSKTPGESFQTVSNYESGKAESVFIAGMFVKYGKEFADLAKNYNKEEDAKNVLESVKNIEQATIKDGWDGEWFVRAYDAYSHKVGSKECEDGKIFIESNGFCTMAGIGKDLGYGKKALNSIHKYLLNDYGIELLYPPYHEYHVELGEISSYPPGNKENGSVFCHNNPWVTLAYCEENEPEEAFDLYKRNAPSYIENISEIHKTEPYVYSQTIAGRCAAHYGEAKNSWLTGTASWSFVALSQGILGIIPEIEGLRIKPCIPKAFNEITLKRIFRGATYNIHITNKVAKEKKMFVDGKEINGDIIPFVKNKKCYDVTITM